MIKYILYISDRVKLFHLFYLQPALKTFEMDIMEQMNIKEDRIPKKFYWY